MLPREFFTAGAAVFTVSNPKDEHFTYRVSARKDRSTPLLFVYVLTGPDNTRDYTYVGVLDETTGGVKLTRKSSMTAASRAYRVADWALRHVWAGKDVPPGYTIEHCGRCGRCGHPLTDPVSIARGLGPTCATK